MISVRVTATLKNLYRPNQGPLLLLNLVLLLLAGSVLLVSFHPEHVSCLDIIISRE